MYNRTTITIIIVIKIIIFIIIIIINIIISAHAWHENGLQRQIGVGPLVSSQE